jgi:hypothetical protein
MCYSTKFQRISDLKHSTVMVQSDVIFDKGIHDDASDGPEETTEIDIFGLPQAEECILRILIPVERMTAWLMAALRKRVKLVKACLMAALMRLPAGQSLGIPPRQEQIPIIH